MWVWAYAYAIFSTEYMLLSKKKIKHYIKYLLHLWLFMRAHTWEMVYKAKNEKSILNGHELTNNAASVSSSYYHCMVIHIFPFFYFLDSSIYLKLGQIFIYANRNSVGKDKPKFPHKLWIKILCIIYFSQFTLKTGVVSKSLSKILKFHVK